jgi:hypothetical protein
VTDGGSSRQHRIATPVLTRHPSPRHQNCPNHPHNQNHLQKERQTDHPTNLRVQIPTGTVKTQTVNTQMSKKIRLERICISLNTSIRNSLDSSTS